jgi:hypothetical protein
MTQRVDSKTNQLCCEDNHPRVWPPDDYIFSFRRAWPGLPLAVDPCLAYIIHVYNIVLSLKNGFAVEKVSFCREWRETRSTHSVLFRLAGPKVAA